MHTKMMYAVRAELANAIRRRYRSATGKQKHKILDEFIATIGYKELTEDITAEIRRAVGFVAWSESGQIPRIPLRRTSGPAHARFARSRNARHPLTVAGRFHNIKRSRQQCRDRLKIVLDRVILEGCAVSTANPLNLTSRS
jgi:hypothetical protein